LLGEVGYEPLDSPPARLDVSELALERRGAGKLSFLLLNDAPTQFLSTTQLQCAATQRLHDIDTTPEGLGCQTTEAGVADGLQVLLVGVHVQRLPVAFSGQARAGATE